MLNVMVALLITLAGSTLVRSWSPTSFEPDSVMEFGF